MNSRERDLDRLYATLDEDWRSPVRLEDVSRRTIPAGAGIYFFFERGEIRPDGRLRVVRVGESGNLRSRLLDQHLTGTHRDNRYDSRHVLLSSIFRHHIGLALIRRDSLSLPGSTSEGAVKTWVALKTSETSNRIERDFERDVEERVTRPIGAMLVTWWLVTAHRSRRKQLEEDLIGLLSNYRGGADDASSDWLGSRHRDERIRESGLWNIKHVEGDYDPVVLDRIRG